MDKESKQKFKQTNKKLADVTPIPKKKPVDDLKKDLHPISLAPCGSKIAEDFVIYDHVKPTALQVPDDNQFGAVLKSFSTLALLEMLHTWTEATDENGSTIKTILFDYRKAFDLIDHSILVSKLRSLSMISWIIDFLSNRFQRVKLVEGCVSEWGSVRSGVPLHHMPHLILRQRSCFVRPRVTSGSPSCQSLFDNNLQVRDHRLHHLLPDTHSSQYTLRHARTFDVKFKTWKAWNFFINSQCLQVSSSE